MSRDIHRYYIAFNKILRVTFNIVFCDKNKSLFPKSKSCVLKWKKYIHIHFKYHIHPKYEDSTEPVH